MDAWIKDIVGDTMCFGFIGKQSGAMYICHVQLWKISMNNEQLASSSKRSHEDPNKRINLEIMHLDCHVLHNFVREDMILIA